MLKKTVGDKGLLGKQMVGMMLTYSHGLLFLCLHKWIQSKFSYYFSNTRRSSSQWYKKVFKCDWTQVTMSLKDII